MLHLRVVDVVEGDVGPAAKVLDQLAVFPDFVNAPPKLKMVF